MDVIARPPLGQTLKIQWFLLNEMCTHLLDSYGRDSLTKFCWNLERKKYRMVKVCVFIENNDYSCLCMKQNPDPMWTKLMKNVDLTELWKSLYSSKTIFILTGHWWKTLMLTNQQNFLTMYIWDVLNVNANRMKSMLSNTKKCLNHVFPLDQLKFPVGKNLTQKRLRRPTTWKDMLCVERYCELANKKRQQLYKVSSPSLDDHHFKEEDLKSVGDLSKVCSQIVLKCLYLARIGSPSVNNLARSVTKWTQACDRRLARLISYIHHISLPTILSCG